MAAGPASPPIVEAIARRRTPRRFDPHRALEAETLRQILELATFAPSEFNLQPWRFVVVRSRGRRRKLLACTFGTARLGDAPAIVIVLGFLNPHRAYLPEILAEEVRRGSLNGDEARGRGVTAARALEQSADRAGWASRTAMLAASTLMLAAHGLGVASALIENRDEGRLRQEFGIPDDHAIAGLIALGYSAEEGPFPGRLPLDSVCHAEHFGQPWEDAHDPT